MWTRLQPDVLVADRTALLVFDMLNAYRPEIEDSGTLASAQRLVTMCRTNGVIICFARAAHRADGSDFCRVVTDTDRHFAPWTSTNPQPTGPHDGVLPDYRSLSELGQTDQDVDIPKHRWSAFHGTALDLTLRVQNIDTVLIIGGSTHVGVASTVFAGRDLDYHMVVVRDACTGWTEQRDFLCDRVFPRMCRVRTVGRVETMLKAGRKG